MHESLRRGELTYKRKEGLERKYLSFKEMKDTGFTRIAEKIEACVNLDKEGSLKFTEEKIGLASIDPYEKQVNQYVKKPKNDMPKVTFDTKELYEHAHHLCQ